MLIVVEGIVMCFVLLIVCVVGISNGPVGLVLLYEKRCARACSGAWTDYKG